jgi:predicted phosphohydrolase
VLSDLHLEFFLKNSMKDDIGEFSFLTPSKDSEDEIDNTKNNNNSNNNNNNLHKNINGDNNNSDDDDDDEDDDGDSDDGEFKLQDNSSSSSTTERNLGHSVLRRLKAIPVLCDIMILAGDIGIPLSLENQKLRERKRSKLTELGLYEDFVELCASKWQHVFVVTGNHEYYRSDLNELDERVRRFCAKFDNVHFLQNSTFVLNGVKWIGTTLWTACPDEEKLFFQYSVNDYRQIRNGDRKLSVDDTNELYRNACAFVRRELAQCEAEQVPCVVVTHHAPLVSFVQSERYKQSGEYIATLDGTDLSALVRDKQHCMAWFFGHTHHSSSQLVHATRFVSNQLGYAKVSPHDGVFAYDYCVAVDGPLPDEFGSRGHF